MRTNRIQVLGSSPLMWDDEELDEGKKMINNLKEEIRRKDVMLHNQYISYKIEAEEYITKMIQEERKKHLLERKAADDEIVRLRLERDHLILAAAMPPTKKPRLDISNEEFDSKFFDEASSAWNANKRRNGPGWTYKCIVPKCDRDGECDFDLCCYECFDKICRNGSCKIKVTSKMKRGFCNECFESTK